MTSDDMSLMFAHRVANLRKLFPYLSADLNAILMRFSAGRTDPYRDLGILISDLRFLSPNSPKIRIFAVDFGRFYLEGEMNLDFTRNRRRF